MTPNSSRDCCGLSCCPATTLVNHSKYFLIIVFDATYHNNMVSCCVYFHPPESSQVKSRVISLNHKSSRKSWRWVFEYDSSQQVYLWVVAIDKNFSETACSISFAWTCSINLGCILAFCLVNARGINSLVNSPNTDVLFIAMASSLHIQAHLCFRADKADNTRLIGLQAAQRITAIICGDSVNAFF